MASYTRLGSYLLSSELVADPAGKIHRGLSLAGSTFERHHLIRTFSDELVEAGIGGKVAEIQRVAGLLAGSRGLGTNYHIESGRTPLVACEYVPGRSLAQVLDKTREEQIPLGVDHSLSVIQGLAQGLMALGAKDLHHGALGPRSIWVSFEGATQIIDAPYAAVMAGLLPRAKGLEASLAPYRAPVPATGLQQDLYALGAVLYELLTLDKLPAREAIPAALAKATLKAAQEEGGFPPEIAALLNRLLLDVHSFSTMGEFNQELERVLYDGDYSPTTFNMAFYMHTLFREESDQDAQSMKADQSADFTPFLPSDASSRSILVAADGTSRVKYFVAAGAVLLGLFGYMGIRLHQTNSRTEDLQNKIADLQREKSANENKIQDISAQQESQRILEEQLAKKAGEAKTTEERAKVKKEQEDAKAKAEELARQKDEALRKKQELANASQVIIQNAQKTQPPPPPPPVPQPIPQPTPVPQPAVVAAPVVQAPTAVQQDVVETPPALAARVNPVVPRILNKSMVPSEMKEHDIKVVLKAFVDSRGKAVKVMIIQGVSGPYGYNDSAQNAALASGYTPATRNGKATTGWLTMEYNFGRIK